MWILALIVALIVVLWIGLQVKPAPFPPYPEPTPPLERVPLPAGLPAPVERFARAAIGAQVPLIETAVLSGSGKLKFMGVTFNSRWRFTHEAGRSYRHYIEATIFGRPLIRVNEWFLDGRSRLELPFGIIGQGPKTDSAANLGLWGEGVWLPAILFTDARVRWEAVDGTTARLIVPSGTGEDSFTVTFDEQTGLMTQLEAMRWRDEKSSEKIRWTNVIEGWKTLQEMKVPAPAGIIWQDQGFAWFTPVIEEAAYNVDVASYIRARGL